MSKIIPMLIVCFACIFHTPMISQDVFHVAPPVAVLVDSDNNGTESIGIVFTVTSQSNTPNSRHYFINAFNLDCPSGLSCTYIPCTVSVPGGNSMGNDYTCTGKITFTESLNYNNPNIAEYTLTFQPSKPTLPVSVDANYYYMALVLPVEMARFDARLETGQVVLEWETASEKDNDKFIVERSWDGKSFQPIGEVAGQGTTAEVQQYYITDQQPLNGISYYRLRQVDFDGRENYSSVVSVQVIGTERVSVFPVPAADFLHIELPEVEGDVVIQLADGRGRVLFQRKTVWEKSLTLDLHQLQKGQYFLQVRTISDVFAERLVKM